MSSVFKILSEVYFNLLSRSCGNSSPWFSTILSGISVTVAAGKDESALTIGQRRRYQQAFYPGGASMISNVKAPLSGALGVDVSSPWANVTRKAPLVRLWPHE